MRIRVSALALASLAAGVLVLGVGAASLHGALTAVPAGGAAAAIDTTALPSVLVADEDEPARALGFEDTPTPSASPAPSPSPRATPRRVIPAPSPSVPAPGLPAPGLPAPVVPVPAVPVPTETDVPTVPVTPTPSPSDDGGEETGDEVDGSPAAPLPDPGTHLDGDADRTD
ncbi:MAG: hypothetical protein NT132_07985 [Microbacterium sp.]|uniref:hypothetical protein n=1 Tax=Microbacterium sp. TaxID=51671 RepID=UPI002638755B|nr:hypothetical protein [Microbacterium sp.]MCX6502326.1 hypothetical protein [Microbacterium sp.]